MSGGGNEEGCGQAADLDVDQRHFAAGEGRVPAPARVAQPGVGGVFAGLLAEQAFELRISRMVLSLIGRR